MRSGSISQGGRERPAIRWTGVAFYVGWLRMRCRLAAWSGTSTSNGYSKNLELCEPSRLVYEATGEWK